MDATYLHWQFDGKCAEGTTIPPGVGATLTKARSALKCVGWPPAMPGAIAVVLGLACTAIATSARSNAVGGGTAGSASGLSAQAQSEFRKLIDTGILADLRWPNFSDFRGQVMKFYEGGGLSLAWIRGDRASPQALAMIEEFKKASMKGLEPEDYDASRWDSRLANIQSPGSPALEADRGHFDLALTVCAMRFISALHVGRVNPQHLKFGLDLGPKKYDVAELLRTRVIEAADLNETINQVEPQYQGYRRAEAALADYLKLAAAGDGPPLPLAGRSIRPGDSYPALTQLIHRLQQLGDRAAVVEVSGSGNTAIYQGATVEAVKHFQRRHGLEPDGIMGRATIARINTPLSLRVTQLQLTLERYRWIPRGFQQPPIVVNIPEFRLRTLRGQPARFLSMKVVVGGAYRHQTPVFANNMRYLIFRPYWDVPFSIQRAELIPKIQRDRDYLAANNYEVVDSDGEVVTDGRVSDEVLGGLRSGEFNIRQKPGPKNALGLAKFIFPNPYNVYLHGTPATELFSRARRDFSHGCIRVEDPVALAAWVLRGKPEWSEDRIRAVMNGDQTVQVNLDQPIPVLILYGTAAVEPNGEVQFFEDIYAYDAALIKALTSGYPYPG
jgi:murein L,D-transpeptidase YcbB/YkuD